jgi:predicted transcriptional regulator
MSEKSHVHLTRRERQIMDVVYRMGQVTVANVLEHMPDPPSYSAVRAMMRLLEEKGHLKHKQEGVRYVYFPTRSRERARQSALQHMLKTFFDGSTEMAVAALLNMSDQDLSNEELQRLAEMIEKAR